jgi:hypothetical protein
VDELSLNLAVDFLEYQRRVVEAQNKAVSKARKETSTMDDTPLDDDRTIDYSPEKAQEQASTLASIMGPAEKMPESLRKMIDWAEQEKEGRGIH